MNEGTKKLPERLEAAPVIDGVIALKEIHYSFCINHFARTR
jgi:hypothetical protein